METTQIIKRKYYSRQHKVKILEVKSVGLYFKSKYTIINMDIVNLEKIEKKLKKLPLPIKEKLFLWVVSVRTKGIKIVRMTKSYQTFKIMESNIQRGKKWNY